MIERYIVIGDIHGCYQELQDLLHACGHSKKHDVVIAAGDLVEKGPNSEAVINILSNLPNAISICGNHDSALIRYKNHELKKKDNPDYKNPMKCWPHRIETFNQLSEASFKYLKSLPFYYRFKAGPTKYLVVHGGMFPNTTPSQMDPNIMMRLRYLRPSAKGYKMVRFEEEISSDVYWADVWTGPERVVFGHSAWLDGLPHLFPWAVGVDTGGCYGLKLTALIVDGKTGQESFVAVPGRQKYCDPLGEKMLDGVFHEHSKLLGL